MAQYPSFWTRRRSAAILCGLQAKSRAVETSQNAGMIVAQVLRTRVNGPSAPILDTPEKILVNPGKCGTMGQIYSVIDAMRKENKEIR